MITPPSPFRYFRDPHHFSSYSEAGEECPFCGLEWAGYGGAFFGEADCDFVCEVCLLNGKLTENGLTTNEGCDLDLLRARPDLTALEAATFTRERTVELEQRTPAVMAWQPLLWPAHCGDFCCFIKEAGQLDMNRLAPDGNGRAFFESHLDEPGRSDVWDTIRPDAPEDNSVGHSVGVYLFQCLECGEYLISWDCD